MSSIKRYNEENSEWEYIAIGKQGIQGPTGPTGPGVPAGGTAGQLLSKIDSISYNSSWVNNFVPEGGSAGEVLVKTDSTDYNIGWAVPVPSGVISPFAGGSVPIGYVLCDGQSLNTTTFANLFSVIGYTYGGSGSSFLVPNLKGRVPVGIDAAQSEFNVRGEVGGAKTHTLTVAQMPSHTHTQNSHNHSQNSHNHSQNSHTHPVAHDSLGTRNVYSEGDAGSFTFGSDDSNVAITYWAFNGTYRFGQTVAATATNNAATATNNATTATNQNTGGGAAHNNLQPYIALDYIIKT